MRSSCLLFVIFIAIYVSNIDIAAAESCPVENCLPANQCEQTVQDATVTCANKKRICCSVVKSEFRTACRHHGGECMDHCTQSLTRTVNDCPTEQVCCVLV